MTVSPDTRHSLLVSLRDIGNHGAWSEFCAIYQPVIRGMFLRRGLQLADAEELTQEVILKVSQLAQTWSPRHANGSFRGWLRTVSKNMAINFTQKLNRKRTESLDGNSSIELLPENRQVLDEEFEAERRRQIFAIAAEELEKEFSAATWQAFWMTSVDLKKPQLVASQLGMTVGAVYIAKSRVLARLKSYVEGVMRQESDF